MTTFPCPNCGLLRDESGCRACDNNMYAWELMFSPLRLPEVQKQIAAWLSQIPRPSMLEISASNDGVRVRFFAPIIQTNALSAWASLTGQQTRWRTIDAKPVASRWGLSTSEILPMLPMAHGDAFLTLAGRLQAGNALQIWVIGQDTELQDKLRALVAYSYGSASGVDNDAPNPWALRLGLLRFGMTMGGLIAGVGGGAITAGWMGPSTGALTILGGGALSLTAMIGQLQWMAWRSIPKEVIETRTADSLLRVAFTVAQPIDGVIAGKSKWNPLPATAWPAVHAFAMPVPAGEVAALITPPENAEVAGVVARDARQDIPAPPPSPDLISAKFQLGYAVATNQPVGIDPDGHGLAVGGSRTGKSSVAFALLKQLIQRGDDAPGIFLVDPHLGLADAFLDACDKLPPDLRAIAIKRLRVISPDQPEIVPLNLLSVPDFSWAGNSMVQLGRRIWDDYWGPRMQAALLGLFRLAHAWNMRNPDKQMGIIHTVFAAYNPRWREEAMSYMSPVERVGALALNALLGQTGSEEGGRGGVSQGWITEVVSPILSKVMSLELSPWLFAAMHQSRFADLAKWIDEKAWVVMRLPAGEIGKEGARLTASIVYNVFESAFRRATLMNPIPYYFVVDEAQEIGAGMRLEDMLSEGAKFGARMFVLTQSLSMMRQVEGFEAVVQSMLANTSSQMFFSPDPEDADLIRATLSATARYGDTTLDLPSLQCWLRARINRQWQPPTLVQIQPPSNVNQERVQAIIRESIQAHLDDYAVNADGWEENIIQAMGEMVTPSMFAMLDKLFVPQQPNVRYDEDEDKEAEKKANKKAESEGKGSKRVKDRLGI